MLELMGARSFLVCVAVAIAWLPGVALGREPTPVKPAGNPGSWVSDEDYPPSALHDDLSGIVYFALKVDPRGIPVECKVTESSGVASLDDTTCSLIMKRARFEPARDRDGNPVESSYLNRVRWALPTITPSPKATNVELSFVVTADGSVSDCILADAKGVSADVIGSLTDPCMTKNYAPFLDETGKPVARQVIMRQSVTIEPVK